MDIQSDAGRFASGKTCAGKGGCLRKGEKGKCIKMHDVVWLRWENTTVFGKGKHYTMVRYRWLKDDAYKQKKQAACASSLFLPGGV